MNTTWFFEPRLNAFGQNISLAGIAGFAVALLIGVLLSAIIQSERVRQLLTRLGLDKKLVAISTGVLALGVLVVSAIIALNLAGLPINWEASIPGLGMSIAHLLRLIVMFVVVFWLVSALKRFLFNRYLSHMGTDRALQYAVAQICGYVALAVGVFIVLQNAGIERTELRHRTQAARSGHRDPVPAARSSRPQFAAGNGRNSSCIMTIEIALYRRHGAGALKRA